MKFCEEKARLISAYAESTERYAIAVTILRTTTIVEVAEVAAQSPPRRVSDPALTLEPFPNLGGLFFRKHTPQPRLRVEYRCANRAFPKVSEQL
jgi:hypothetical protein